MKRKVFFAGAIVSLFGAAIFCWQQGLISYWQNKFSQPAGPFNEFVLTVGDIFDSGDDPNEMIVDLVTEGKNWVSSTIMVSTADLLQPIGKLQTPTSRINWQQNSFEPVSIVFYYEDVVIEGEQIKMIRTFECSPSFILAIHPQTMVRNNKDKQEDYHRLRRDPAAIIWADQQAAKFQLILDYFSAPSEKNLYFNNQPYKSFDFKMSQPQARRLRSYVGVYVIFLEYTKSLVELDPQGFSVEAVKVSLPGQPPTNTFIQPTLSERLKNRQAALGQVVTKLNHIRQTWPAAYISYFLRHHPWQSVFRQISQNWPTLYFALLVLLAGYGFWQGCLRDVNQLINQGLMAGRVGITPRLMRQALWRLYRRHPVFFFFQPWARRLNLLVSQLCLEIKKDCLDQELTQQAQAAWGQITINLGSEAVALRGQYQVAVNPKASFHSRQLAIGQLENFLGKLVEQTASQAAMVLSKPVRPLEPGRQEQMVRQLVKDLADNFNLILVEEQLERVARLSKAKVRCLTSLIETIGGLGRGVIVALVNCNDLEAILDSRSDLVLAAMHRQWPTVKRVLGINEEVTNTENDTPLNQTKNFLSGRRVVLITASKLSQKKLVQVILELGAESCESIAANNIRRVQAAAEGGKLSGQLFVVAASSPHNVSNILRKIGVTFLWVNTYSPGFFRERLLERLSALSANGSL
ncbi:MAG: hypothetical protein A2729_01715 [Candidatus Buchananbacteria bacterium RIFCSPHIGHO2_01_FULL_39_14]|uniref:Uncharacterized protein n=2 Tax=Candidatus Buchananiibacteriota TaxID=1817903 RepID=A0A1G1YP28_9BACT|nr:MAG: hypothetical protein A2729_01715 [Candidatus Buchananbacteria bacterium RIFCSPHIGHO2_01_FULL_39_14]OGY48819.1 MAG: hypothetical protein A3D39_03385 [Candidatus Buchananbacteria bacterium RIFCSPHIGHO2_02_FULL_39_17]OGY54105.1 MAG: hypothetical protein A2912_01910 [Candidatus Buchananbacteria bacterium RIFCSPLOWO2_01_FULL_40_23b]